MAAKWSFLDFPMPIRQRIYEYLLAPHPRDNETVLNYTLTWNWLENPSNTTFGGVQQIDLCHCPRQKRRAGNSKIKPHMYVRYKCQGPEVTVKSGREDLWVPSQMYATSKQINFLRPAEDAELSRRPTANILSTCKKIYEEALPILYRGRNILLVTGPCPRGRYQAYATQRFLSGLSSQARTYITAFSLNAIPHEEDCRDEDVPAAYGDLVVFIQRNLPSIRSLGVYLWHPRLADALKKLEVLLANKTMKIELDNGRRDGWVEEYDDAENFRAALTAARQR